MMNTDDTSSNANTSNSAPQNQASQQNAPGGSPPTTDPLSAGLVSALTSENEALKAELEQAKKQLEEMLKISQNALADLQNFRRRSEEEKASFIEFANANLLKTSVLPFLDNMNRAVAHDPKDAEWVKGVEQTYALFQTSLKNLGLKAYDSVGQKLDPKIHEVLMTGPGEQDVIIQEVEKGYMLGEKVLKPAKVIAGNGTPVQQ